MMRELLFIENVHRPGINVTVRRGEKWLGLEKDEPLLLKSAKYGDNEHPAIRAVAITSLLVSFNSIPESILKHEHDPKCHTRDGLYEAMCRAYPTFRTDETVTIVLYYVEER